MSIAENVPQIAALPEPSGRRIGGISLRGRTYRMRADEATDLHVDAVLKARGIVSEVDRFLAPRLDRDLPDPSLLAGMDAAAKRIADAVQRRQKIVIFGDYDVDGASASAVLGRWFDELGADFSIYIPDRMTEGYGPSSAAFAKAAPDGTGLIVCVDCGTASHEPISEAVDRGIDVVVVDHHKVQGDLPEAVAVVNPHRPDCSSGLTMMCAAALAFLTAVASQRELRGRGFFKGPEPRLKDLLDIVALATVADVVPLIGPSRMLVAKGLEVMAKSPSPGVAALIKVSGVDQPNSGRIGFALGPRVNAGGRVGAGSASSDGALGVRLLMSRSHEEAESIAKRLDEMNRERQLIEQQCLEEAMSLAAEQVEAGRRSIAVWGQGWHPGVVGIVASRLREKFDRPAIVGGFDGGVIKGSGRSVSGFDLGAVVVEARSRGMLVGGGGHAMACGLSCDPASWEEFIAFLEKRTSFEPEPLPVDCVVRADAIRVDAIAGLEALQPLGQGMPAVRVAIEGVTVHAVREIGKGHAKVSLRHGGGQIDGLWWRAADDGFFEKLRNLVDSEVVALGAPGVNEWQGRKTAQIELCDLIVPGVLV